MRKKGSKIEKNRNLGCDVISVKVLAKPSEAGAVLQCCHTWGREIGSLHYARTGIGCKLLQEEHLTWGVAGGALPFSRGNSQVEMRAECFL